MIFNGGWFACRSIFSSVFAWNENHRATPCIISYYAMEDTFRGYSTLGSRAECIVLMPVWNIKYDIEPSANNNPIIPCGVIINLYGVIAAGFDVFSFLGRVSSRLSTNRSINISKRSAAFHKLYIYQLPLVACALNIMNCWCFNINSTGKYESGGKIERRYDWN